MFRRPGTGPSKASATTLCQKCLQRGHYSYECKAKASDRPYKTRPSRTQQLLNPSLKPKLTTEVPTDLVRNKGIADDILKKKDQERGRLAGRKRSRSRSRSRSSSVDSVSTISTNRSPSRSRSPPPRRQKQHVREKRSRRSVSMESHSSVDSRQRNTRRRVSEFSPEQRGRRGSREGSARDRSRSGGRHSKRAARGKDVSAQRSADRMDVADDRPRRAENSRQDRSPSPYSSRRNAYRSPSPQPERDTGRGREAPQSGGRNMFGDEPVERNGRGGVRQAPPPPRERSLSPFSKRVAMTRAMNGA